MTRAEVIDRILAQRVRRVDELDALDRVATELDLALADLNGVRLTLCDKVDSDNQARLLRMGVQVDDIGRRATSLRQRMSRTSSRFRRPTLVIGTIGRSGQGKSAFLQSLTGLTGREIPAAKGGFMTGVPSLIRHGSGTTIAEVELHDETSFLEEVLRPYYLALGLTPFPASFGAFRADPLPELPQADSTTQEASAYEHLRRYRDHLPEYQQYLQDSTRVRPIQPEEIIRFVAQHDESGRPTHAFRAVRRVRITTPFGQPDLGLVSVVDLPGLGDTNLRDEYLLRQAIDGEVDVVIFVRRPDPLRDDVHDVDVQLYDIARNAMPELALDRWSFMLLNRVETEDGGNAAMVDRFAGMVRKSKIRVVDVLEANCIDRDEVNTAFDQVIDHAVQVVDELDKSLLERHRQELDVILAETGRLVAEARVVGTRAAPEGTSFLRFQQLFEEAYKALSRALERLVRKYQDDVTATDEELSRQIRVVVESASEAVVPPTIEEIEDRRDEKGGYTAALVAFVDEKRAQISRQFLSLDDALKARVAAMQSDIVDVLRASGQLGTSWPQEGKDFLVRLADQIDQVPTGSDELSHGIRFVADFTLNYRGFIQHRVRRVLKKLVQDTETTVFKPGSGPADIQYMLEELIAEILYNIQAELGQMTHEPYEVVFAVTEELRDRVLRAEGTRAGWEAVYNALRSEIWADEFEALAANTILFNQWNKALTTLAALAGTAV